MLTATSTDLMSRKSPMYVRVDGGMDTGMSVEGRVTPGVGILFGVAIAYDVCRTMGTESRWSYIAHM